MEKYLQTFSNQERIDPISTRHSLYIRTVGPYSILPIIRIICYVRRTASMKKYLQLDEKITFCKVDKKDSGLPSRRT